MTQRTQTKANISQLESVTSYLHGGGIKVYLVENDNENFIGSRKFLHSNIHKYICESPGGSTRNQIDHGLVSRLFLGSLMDVEARRGAGSDSTHKLLVATFRLRPVAMSQGRKVANIIPNNLTTQQSRLCTGKVYAYSLLQIFKIVDYTSKMHAKHSQNQFLG